MKNDTKRFLGFMQRRADNYREELLAIYHAPTVTETYQIWYEFSFNVSNGLQI